MNNFFVYNFKIGKIYFEDNGKNILRVGFLKEKDLIDCNFRESDLTVESKKQLEEYLDGKRKEFSLPLLPDGTIFQKAVWNELLKIPYGKTKSYSDIAFAINNPKAFRAVGMANNKNPIAIFIPCHRVIGKNGDLVGYGSGIQMKKKLLNIEKFNLN